MNSFKQNQRHLSISPFFKVSSPISLCKLFVRVLTIPEFMILNALFCTDSRISSLVSVQLQLLEDSRSGRMKEIYSYYC